MDMLFMDILFMDMLFMVHGIRNYHGYDMHSMTCTELLNGHVQTATPSGSHFMGTTHTVLHMDLVHLVCDPDTRKNVLNVCLVYRRNTHNFLY
jgi:hypothetical protein